MLANERCYQISFSATLISLLSLPHTFLYSLLHQILRPEIKTDKVYVFEAISKPYVPQTSYNLFLGIRDIKFPCKMSIKATIVAATFLKLILDMTHSYSSYIF